VIAYTNELVADRITFEPYAGKLRLTYENANTGDWVRRPSAKAWEPGILRARVHDLRDSPTRCGPERMRTLHVRRQWLCMDKLLCQVCARPATDPRTGLIPWLLPETAFERTGLKTGRTHAPPTCWDCIPKAAEEWLQGAGLCTVAGVRPAGVLADLYRPGVLRALMSTTRNVFVAWDDYQHHRYALATSQVVELQGIRSVL
jgi:hypothetical protein